MLEGQEKLSDVNQVWLTKICHLTRGKCHLLDEDYPSTQLLTLKLDGHWSTLEDFYSYLRKLIIASDPASELIVRVVISPFSDVSSTVNWKCKR